MKKLLILIVLLGIIASGLYFGASTFQTIEPIRPFVRGYVEFMDTLFGIEKAEIKEVETNDVFNDTETTKETVTNDKLDEDEYLDNETLDPEENPADTEAEVDPTDTEIDTEELVDTRTKVPEYINLGFFENELLNFTYPSDYEIQETSEYSLDINKNGIAIAYIDVFENPDKLSLADFLKKDNINNYLADAASLKLNTETLEVGEQTILIKGYPGLETHDVYLIVFSDKVLLAKVFKENEAVKKFLISTIEER